MPVLVICTDLLFATRIHSTAKSLHVPTVSARTLAAIPQQLAAAAIPLAIVDLNTTALDPRAAIRMLKQHPAPPRVIAFLSHVQVDLAQAARDAGADLVLARSGFTAQLPAILQSAQSPAP